MIPALRQVRSGGVTRMARVLIGWLFLMVGGGGCVSVTQQSSALSQAWESGNRERAAQVATRNAEARDGTRDALLWHLEKGTVLRFSGDIEESIKAFEKAWEITERYDQEAAISLGGESLAALSNMSYLPYRGYAYDRIMMQSYQALNYLQTGNLPAARVALNRAMNVQRDAVQNNARRIEREKEAIRSQGFREQEQASHGRFDANRAEEDPRFQRQLQNQFRTTRETVAYADYVNPFAVYLDGLFFLYHPESAADLERARVSLRRVLEMVPENTFVEQDLATYEQIVSGVGHPPLTYIFVEMGQGPQREQITIDFPLYMFSGDVPYVGAAFPRLNFRPSVGGPIMVRAADQRTNTRQVVNMNAVVAREFDNLLPLVTTKTLTSSAIKAATTYAAREVARQQSQTMGILVNLGGMIYQYMMNDADLRQWVTLPQRIEVARLETPESGVVEISWPGAGTPLSLPLTEHRINFIFIRMVSPYGQPMILQTHLP